MTRFSTVKRTAVLLLGGLFAASSGFAGIDALFSDGFETGNTTVWELPTRFVVFEGFLNPG